MGPEEVVHGLEDGEVSVPGLEGFEAAEGAVEALRRLLLTVTGRPLWLTGVLLNWATTCLVSDMASAMAGG